VGYPSVDVKTKVVSAYLAGNSVAHLVEIFSFHRNTISRWIKTSEKDPNFTRNKNPGSGRLPKLQGRGAKKLLGIVSKPASKFGFETDFWTTARIQRICVEKLGLKVSRMSIHRTLVKFEQSYKKPQKNILKHAQTSRTVG
jgi:transposase